MNTKPNHTLPLKTCVTPEGRFVHLTHRPSFEVANLREDDHIVPLGWTEDGRPLMNHANFPPLAVQEPEADTIYEIPNPFPFRGATYICKSWADARAGNPAGIAMAKPSPVSLHRSMADRLQKGGENSSMQQVLNSLPDPLQLALASTSTDPADLQLLAESCCRFQHDSDNRPTGLMYEQDAKGRHRPCIIHHQLFETVANNPHLPDDYKEAMVLRPGAQGGNEIVGEWRSGQSHIYEYLRRNSYIPWGHYAANMAHDAVRYAIGDLTLEDITGLRHLYYQRTYTRLARDLKAAPVTPRSRIPMTSLEALRSTLLDRIRTGQGAELAFNCSLWGWNYGFGYASSGYRLHASHQQIHQQFAMIPREVSLEGTGSAATQQAYACGDLIKDLVGTYRRQTGADFFTCYQNALAANQRLDGRTDRPASLVVYEDEHMLLFVPKAQTSQWELQLMPVTSIGNILEADTDVRRSLDRALFVAMRILAGMGATMISVIEYSKRFDDPETGQRLLYDFLPKMPESPGAFSEAQLRWINGHYPEDFAEACRMQLKKTEDIEKAVLE